MKSVEKYKRLIQAIKNTEKFPLEEIDTETMNIAIQMFNNLPIADKFEILQDAVNKKTEDNVEAESVSSDPDADTTKDQKTESVEEFNKKELIKLKIFFLKFLTIGIIAVLSLFALTYLLLGSIAVHTGNAVVNEAIAIFEYLFN